MRIHEFTLKVAVSNYGVNDKANLGELEAKLHETFSDYYQGNVAVSVEYNTEPYLAQPPVESNQIDIQSGTRRSKCK